MSKHTTSYQKQQGFTIVELMIATTVLAVILVLVTAMMIGIGNLYYKGVNQTRVQNDSRNVVDDISQHLKLSDTPPLTEATGTEIAVSDPFGGYTLRAYCLDDVRYSYVLDRQIGTGTEPNGRPRIAHVLWRDPVPSSGCSPADLRTALPSPTGTELIVSSGRLTAFSLSLVTPYNINIGIALGDFDLLSGSGMNTTCRGGIGQQFCATSVLSTSVTQRITRSVH